MVVHGLNCLWAQQQKMSAMHAEAEADHLIPQSVEEICPAWHTQQGL